MLVLYIKALNCAGANYVSLHSFNGSVSRTVCTVRPLILLQQETRKVAYPPSSSQAVITILLTVNRHNSS